MNIVQISIALAAAATIFGAASLVFKAVNRRIRLLALSVSLLTVCQVGAIFSRVIGWNSPDLTRSLEILELTAGALSLSVIHLLNRENKDRRQVDASLRVLEPLNISNGVLRLAEHVGKSNEAGCQRKSLRFRMHAHATLCSVDSPDVGLSCEVRDISQSGVGLIVSTPLNLKSAVELDLGGPPIPAIVARCQPAGPEFSVGLSFESQISGSRVAEIVRNTYVSNELSRT